MVHSRGRRIPIVSVSVATAAGVTVAMDNTGLVCVPIVGLRQRHQFSGRV